MEQQNTEQKTVLEQIADNVRYFYKNGWEQLFENGMAIQDAVLADIMCMAQNSDYAKDKGFSDEKNKDEFLQKAPVFVLRSKREALRCLLRIYQPC